MLEFVFSSKEQRSKAKQEYETLAARLQERIAGVVEHMNRSQNGVPLDNHTIASKTKGKLESFSGERKTELVLSRIDDTFSLLYKDFFPPSLHLKSTDVVEQIKVEFSPDLEIVGISKKGYVTDLIYDDGFPVIFTVSKNKCLSKIIGFIEEAEVAQ